MAVKEKNKPLAVSQEAPKEEAAKLPLRQRLREFFRKTDIEDSFSAFEKNDDNEAIRLSSRIIDRNPKYADAYICRGIAYLSKNEFDKAIYDFRKASQLGDSDAPYYLELAEKLKKAGEK